MELGPDGLPLPQAAPKPGSSAVGGTRSWLNSWRRITQPTPPDIDPLATQRPAASGLLQHGPFHVGFFLALGGLTAYGLLEAASQLTNIILMVILAMAVALGLTPAVEFLHDRGLRRGLCVLVVVIGLLALVGLLVWAVIPMASSQLQTLVANLPSFMDNLQTIPQIKALDEQFDIISQINQFIVQGKWADILSSGMLGAVGIISNMVFSLVVTAVLTIYFLASLPTLKEAIYRLSPASRRPRTKYLVNEMMKRVGGYVSGLFMVSLMATVFTYVVLNILGLYQYALALAALLMLFYFIPIVGSSIAIIVIAIVGFTHSPLTGILCLVILFAYQQFDAYFIQPRVFSRSVQVPGILVILGAISGGLLYGMTGAILAVPVMAAALILYREVLIPHLDRR
ncbi:MAG: AI-2E family transporter [Propionibacteriaceae bacterium]|jgi:predicted PurR-regulated permease PerM|nr:AI-2E family transporter [Propionibacteriaceae bacterium]